MEVNSIGNEIRNKWRKFDPKEHGLPEDFVLTNFSKLKG